MLSPWGPERDGWGSSHLSVFVSSSLQSYWGIRLHSLHIFKVIFTTRRARKFILFQGEPGSGSTTLERFQRPLPRWWHGCAWGHGWWQPDVTSRFEQHHQWHVCHARSHYLFVTLGNKVYEEEGWKYRYFTFGWKLTALSPWKSCMCCLVFLKDWHSTVLPSSFPSCSEEMRDTLPFWKALQGNNQQAPCNCNL